MNINVSNFRQEVSKVRLSKNAFDELLNAQEIIESDTRNGRFDIKPAYVNPLLLPVLSEELHRIRNMIDHESHVLILDGFKVEKTCQFQIAGVDIRFFTRCANGTEPSRSQGN